MVHSNPAFNEFTAIEASITAFIGEYFIWIACNDFVLRDLLKVFVVASQTCNQEKRAHQKKKKRIFRIYKKEDTRRYGSDGQHHYAQQLRMIKKNRKIFRNESVKRVYERVERIHVYRSLNALKSFVHPIPTPLKHQDEATRRTYGRSSASSGAGPAGAGAARDLGRTLPGAGMSRPHADKEFKYVIKVKSIVGLGKQLALYRYRRWHESRSRSETNVTFKLLFLL
ncbi:hypothetical protein H4Q26_007841 [Puccinia striiformis f. sp. tritici PST-130]|nr:hypothetical protein H4Q26_007841 [Puccinia striiformis f. sp. tritici PST-130]